VTESCGPPPLRRPAARELPGGLGPKGTHDVGGSRGERLPGHGAGISATRPRHLG
jgi:hypothetical protein